MAENTSKKRGYSDADREFLTSLGVDASGRKGAKGSNGPRQSTVDAAAIVAKGVGRVKGAAIVTTADEGTLRQAHPDLPASLKVAADLTMPMIGEGDKARPVSLRTAVQQWAKDNGREVVKLPSIDAFVVKPA